MKFKEGTVLIQWKIDAIPNNFFFFYSHSRRIILLIIIIFSYFRMHTHINTHNIIAIITITLLSVLNLIFFLFYNLEIDI